MKQSIIGLLLVAVLALTATAAASQPLTTPTFNVTAVDQGNTVTIKAVNFPANDSFNVTMGDFGTMGIGGLSAGTQDSGSGSFTATYSIPAALVGKARIAIRLVSPTSGYYSYNWFWNNTATGGAAPDPAPAADPVIDPAPAADPLPAPASSWGYPAAGWNSIPNTNITTSTESVDVTVKGTNFTTNDTYQVFIGKFGTKGVGGIKVDTFTTDGTGKFTKTFSVPAALKDNYKLAIRFQSTKSGYYAYDWWVNKASASPGPSSSSGYPPAGPATIPTFKITAVEKNNTVTIKAVNFTTHDTFNVYMGAMGTKGIGGIKVATHDTDGTGNFTATFDIPPALHGKALIAIRLQSPTTSYYSYNWFYNNNAP